MNPASPHFATEHESAILHAVLNTAIDAIITIDTAGVIHHLNPAVERLFGYTPEELIGRNVAILMPEPDRSRHDQYIHQYTTTRVAKIIGIGREVIARHKNGTEFPVDLAVSEILVGDKRFFTGILRDMTDRRRTEAALQREKMFADNLLDTANAAVLILDEAGRVSRFNHFFERLTGYSDVEVRGVDWFEHFVMPNAHAHAKEWFAETMAERPIHSFPLPIRCRNGQSRLVAWAGRRLINADEIINGMLAIGNDITELQEAEQKLIQQERLAAIGQMVTGLAHESRNALQRSRACLDMLELDCNDSPDQIDLVHRTQQALVELQRLYEEVRSYASPINLERVDCDLAVLCREVWEMLDALWQPYQIQLKVQWLGESHLCRCDRQRMIQVIRNILENALAVSPPQSIIRVFCEKRPYRNGTGIQLRFCDEGPGLSLEQRQRIFEPFYTTKTKGTGLGMPISQRILESHGGEIWVGQSARCGAEIGVVLPTS